MRLLICGSRDWRDEYAIRNVINHFNPSIICQGEARGADLIAKSICILRGLEYVGYKADWKTHGKGAGPVRNRRMLAQFRPDIVVAFKDEFDRTMRYGGTEDMCKISLAAGVETWLVYHTHEDPYFALELLTDRAGAS